MKRFFFEEEGDEDEEDEMAEDAGNVFPEMIPEIFAMAHGMENPDQQILNYAIRICEQTFLWRFRSVDRKMKMVESVFEDLKRLVESN